MGPVGNKLVSGNGLRIDLLIEPIEPYTLPPM